MKKPEPASLSDIPGGPAPNTLIANISELPSHGGKDVIFSDGSYRLQLIVQRYENTVYVYENRCPHAGTPLNLFDDRFLDISGQQIICRTHGALFSPESGKCVHGPCRDQYLRPIAFEIREGKIYSV